MVWVYMKQKPGINPFIQKLPFSKERQKKKGIVWKLEETSDLLPRKWLCNFKLYLKVKHRKLVQWKQNSMNKNQLCLIDISHENIYIQTKENIKWIRLNMCEKRDYLMTFKYILIRNFESIINYQKFWTNHKLPR